VADARAGPGRRPLKSPPVSRPLVFFFALVLLAGLAGYGVTRHFLPAPVTDAEARHRWLREEFDLDPAQAARIDALQSEYKPVCASHCAAIARTRDQLDAAIDATTRTAALIELDRLKVICTEATRAHLQAVAACMAPDQGARFLALMEPRVAHGENQTGAPALDRRP